MSYRYNRLAFARMARSPQPLLALYGSLIRLELALKAHDGSCQHMRHEIITMLNAQAGLNASLVEQLRSALGALWRTKEDGFPARIPMDSYPHLRYLRHRDDHPGAGAASTDQDLEGALSLVRDIEQELIRSRISL
jgi:hypothetical protein